MPTLDILVDSTRASAIAWLHVFVLLTWIEFALPKERHSFRHRVRSLAFWAVTIPFTVVSSAYLGMLWHWIGVDPIVNIPLRFAWMGSFSYVFTALIAAFVGDFFLYWFHRAQHRWLWNYHAVHHSITELNAVNSYSHFTESTFQNLFIVIPTSLIVLDTGPTLPYLVIVMRLHPIFIHSPVKLHFGFLRCLFVDNRMHRIHHSMEERHFDKNFGVFTTLWDRLFGTAYYPRPDEWPATGIAGAAEPRTVRERITMPWRRTSANSDRHAANESAQTQQPAIAPSSPIPTARAAQGGDETRSGGPLGPVPVPGMSRS